MMDIFVIMVQLNNISQLFCFTHYFRQKENRNDTSFCRKLYAFYRKLYAHWYSVKFYMAFQTIRKSKWSVTQLVVLKLNQFTNIPINVILIIFGSKKSLCSILNHPPLITLERYITQAQQTISKPLVVAEGTSLITTNVQSINSKDIYTANHK